MDQAFIGYDPGGVAANGIAIIRCGGGGVSCETSVVSSVDEALRWSLKALNGAAPAAIGIDTFLFWETGESGWRAADRWLRSRYPEVSQSVFSSNSSRGAMSIQGMAFAIEARRIWPEVSLIEAHPKVLYFAIRGHKHAWPGEMIAWLGKQIGAEIAMAVDSDHAWDALISAWAARESRARPWSHDLKGRSTHPIEPAGSVRYPWPE